jgi:hypothetical protein
MGCTAVTTEVAPDATEGARPGSVKSPTTSTTLGSAGAVPGRRTMARTLAPRSTSASQIRDPTNPFAPVTTTVAADDGIDSVLARIRVARCRSCARSFPVVVGQLRQSAYRKERSREGRRPADRVFISARSLPPAWRLLFVRLLWRPLELPIGTGASASGSASPACRHQPASRGSIGRVFRGRTAPSAVYTVSSLGRASRPPSPNWKSANSSDW